ncbi:unnamed protein product [Rodentolepis nana]|uniref:Ig-like domain-containing protein n=1 Tax=Rodentolepis nana TaxID=102285 RepID=A0A158QI31_RODNA|nr:unnamed protein product [Rodentolepis nana]
MKPLESVRAWVMSKTDSLLHILIFCQHSDSSGVINEDDINVELLSYGCDPDAAPNVVAAFGLSGKDAILNKIPEHSGVERMTYGLAVNIILKDYSTFYRYDLQAAIGENRTSLLVVPPSGNLRLKEEIEGAKFDVFMTKYYTTQDSDNIRAEIQVALLSPILLDHLNCTNGSLKLTPSWGPDDAQNKTLKHTPTVFDLTAPKYMKKLNFTIDVVIGENCKRTEFSLPNPHHETINIEFENTTGILSWEFVSPELQPAVSEYTVDVTLEDIGCGTRDNVTLNYLAALNCTKTRGCTTHLWSVEQFLNKRDILANYIITISPNYDSFYSGNSVSGAPSQLKFTHGEQGHSSISLSGESMSPWTQAVVLQPSRKAQCAEVIPEEMDASFELTAYAILAHGKVELPLEDVRFEKLFPSTYGMGGTYKVTNLQPGREYKIKGFIKYPGNLSDLVSEEVTFTTPDDTLYFDIINFEKELFLLIVKSKYSFFSLTPEIIVSEKYIRKDVGDSLLFNCSAAVGTDPRFRKDVRWLRSGEGSESMPEGAFSLTAAFPDDRGFLTASLSIPKIDDTHAGLYCCSPEPPVEHFYGQTPTCVGFRLIVNDLKLDRYYLEANPGMAVSVTCSTKREGELQWRGPDRNLIASTQTRHISASNLNGGTQSLILLLNEVGSENVGEYQCCFQPKEGEARTPETFSLRLKESLFVRRQIQPITSLRFGEIETLTCVSSKPAGEKQPRLKWYRIQPASPGSNPSNVTLESVGSFDDGHLEVIEETDASCEAILRVKLTPASRGRYVCASFTEEVVDLASEDKILKEELLQKAVQHVPSDVSYNSAVEISEPISYQNGEGVTLRCTGYPSHAGEHLEWGLKEFPTDDTYVFNGNSQDLLVLADKERISHIMSCFRPNLTKSIANWPGAEVYNPLSARHELYSPDEIEIIALSTLIEDPICQAAIGQLVCFYRSHTPRSASSSSHPTSLAMLTEVGPNSRKLSTTTEAKISLDSIRKAYSNQNLQGSASMQKPGPNKSISIYRHEIFTSLLVALITAITASHVV